jgi:transposase
MRKERPAMLGIKERAFGPLPSVTLEELVPPDHFYRHFVRDLVHEAYADIGRPSIDPVVFFKLQLVMFFEGIRSERKLIATASLNLAHRWYLGYALDEDLPDHSSLARIRQRLGVEIFQLCLGIEEFTLATRQMQGRHPTSV